MKNLRKFTVAISGAALAATSIIAIATPASAIAGISCNGRSEGMCVYRNTGFAPPFAWFAKPTNIQNFGNWTYASTSYPINDSISSASNWSYFCTAYVYQDAGYLGNYVAFGPRLVLSDFGGSAIGDDRASSLYWTC